VTGIQTQFEFSATSYHPGFSTNKQVTVPKSIKYIHSTYVPTGLPLPVHPSSNIGHPLSIFVSFEQPCFPPQMWFKPIKTNITFYRPFHLQNKKLLHPGTPVFPLTYTDPASSISQTAYFRHLIRARTVNRPLAWIRIRIGYSPVWIRLPLPAPYPRKNFLLAQSSSP
jgi:hypothetical protein